MMIVLLQVWQWQW